LSGHIAAAVHQADGLPEDVATAQRALEAQIQQAAQQLDTLVSVLTQRMANPANTSEISELRQQLAQSERARNEAADECDRLRDKVIEREQNLDRLRGEQGDTQAT